MFKVYTIARKSFNSEIEKGYDHKSLYEFQSVSNLKLKIQIRNIIEHIRLNLIEI